MDVLCADKTGTLTQNKLTLGDPFCGMIDDVMIFNRALTANKVNHPAFFISAFLILTSRSAAKVLSERPVVSTACTEHVEGVEAIAAKRDGLPFLF